MKIAELSRQSGVSIATIKFYLREGLLAPGRLTAANQATYTDEHIRRLRLIRALVDVGGLTLTATRRVLVAVDDEKMPLHDAFGAVMHALDDVPQEVDADLTAAVGEMRAWLDRRGWMIQPDAPAPVALARLLLVMQRFDLPLAWSALDRAADVADAGAAMEVSVARERSTRTAAVETMVVGTVVYERVLAEVRRLALENASARLDAVSGGATRRSTARAATPRSRSRPG